MSSCMLRKVVWDPCEMLLIDPNFWLNFASNRWRFPSKVVLERNKSMTRDKSTSSKSLGISLSSRQLVLIAVASGLFSNQLLFILGISRTVLSGCGNIQFTDNRVQQQHAAAEAWVDIEQFAANSYPSMLSSNASNITNGGGLPKEEEWLIGDHPVHSMVNGGGAIPKNIHKVNILNQGTLEQVFRRNASELNLNVSNDRAVANLQKAHLSWKTRNPGYSIRYFGLNDCRHYLETNFHPIFLRAFDCLEAYACKADLFRYLVVYREGGWYIYWKQVCLVDNLLDTLGSGNTTWFSGFDGANFKYRGVTTCYSNGFFGATPQHPVLSNAIIKVLHNIQSYLYGDHATQPTGPCTLGLAVIEEGYAANNVNSSRIGTYNYHRNTMYNGYTYEGNTIVQHKCNDCGVQNDWASGNNYYTLWESKHYYCSDAATLFYY